MTKLYADEALYALLCKYVLGEADAGERQWVDDWLRSDRSPAVVVSLEKLLKEQPQYRRDARRHRTCLAVTQC